MNPARKMLPTGPLVVSAIVAFCHVWVAGIDQAQAQGLIWSLPEDGTEVRYEGEIKQVEVRPDALDGNITLEWIRHLTLKSVGRETAEYNGKQVPCRWIEIKVETGKESESGIDTGLAGKRIYKVLIPESRVFGQLVDGKSVDGDNIPASYIPIVKGWRKIGDKSPREIQSKVLQIYPSISLLRHFKTLQAESNQPEDLQIGPDAVTAKKYKGSYRLESRTSRSVHEAELWLSSDVPFGLAKWRVKIVHERKSRNEPRATGFKTATEVTLEMKAQQIGSGAKSELNVP